MEKIDHSLEKLYLGLNQTVSALYSSLSDMSVSSVETNTNIKLLKKKYESNSSDRVFLNRTIISFIPHMEKIKKRDKEYFKQFIIDQAQKNIQPSEVKEIEKFISSLTPEYLRILWTFADNFVLIGKKFQEICKNSEWLQKECEKISREIS